MKEEELKNKCTERAKIFQQAMKSCKSSSPIDCIEWFADRIAELEKENAELKEKLEPENCLKLLVKDGYIKFTSDNLTKAKEIIKALLRLWNDVMTEENVKALISEAEQFISEVEK